MSILVKGILSFPNLFTPKAPKGSNTPRFDGQLLIAPNNPDLAKVQQAFNEAIQNGFPSGLPPKADVCFMPYDTKFHGKDYYDPRFTGWHVLSFTAKQDNRPAVVDQNYNPVIDPGSVYSGMVVYVNLAIASYTAGTGGIGGFLNGVMTTAEEPPMGRLDNKPTVEQMFAGITAHPESGNVPSPQNVTAPAPTPPAPPVPNAAPAAPPANIMTEKAGGVPYESFIAQGWTDETLVANGYMIKPSFG